MPQGVFETISKFAPTHEYVFMDDEHAMKFLTERFQPKVLERFKQLRRGSHKVRQQRYGAPRHRLGRLSHHTNS